MPQKFSTGRENSYKGSYTILSLLILATLPATPALPLDQTQAQEDARRIHDQGADDSLDQSYGNGLRAVNHFFNFNIPGAVTHGVKAYGQYRNSEKLDDLKDKNKHLKGAMGSVGISDPSGPSAITGSTEYISPFSRLDKKFLRKGETGEIAAKVEKLSGLSREKMFDMMVETHKNSKYFSDPDFVKWSLKTYRDLVKQAPNKEFRETMNKFGDKADWFVNTAAFKVVLTQFAAVDKTDKLTLIADTKPIDASATERAPATEAAPVKEEPRVTPIVMAEAAPDAAEETTPDPNGLDASASFNSRGVMGADNGNSRPGFDRLEYDAKDKFFAGLVQAAIQEERGPSIFETVSRKIKEVSQRDGLQKAKQQVVAQY